MNRHEDNEGHEWERAFVVRFEQFLSGLGRQGDGVSKAHDGERNNQQGLVVEEGEQSCFGNKKDHLPIFQRD
jgi:hypothetical protein